MSPRLLAVLIVGVLVAVVLYASVTFQPPRGDSILKELSDMRTELQRVRKIMWIGPHADDEMYVVGLLYYAHLMGKECTIVAYRARSGNLNRISAQLLG